MAAFSSTGKVINIGDRVSIIGLVVSIGGYEPTSAVFVQPPLSPSPFACQAYDIYVTEGVQQTGSGIAKNNFFNPGDNCTVLGLVTAISGSGNYALLTVTMSNSGLSVSGIPSGACTSDNV